MSPSEPTSSAQAQRPQPQPPPLHRRTSSGSGFLSRLSFMRASSDGRSRQELPDSTEDDGHDDPTSEKSQASAPTQPTPRASVGIIQQHRTRRRRGSLRKVALLGRGAQRERKDRPADIDTSSIIGPSQVLGQTPTTGPTQAQATEQCGDAAQTSQLRNGDSSRPSPATGSPRTMKIDAVLSPPPPVSQPSYASTDEEDVLQIPRAPAPLRQGLSLQPGGDSYFGNLGAKVPQRRRSIQRAKSPLSYGGLSSNAVPAHDGDWDYSDTEWWGWVVLGVTWFVFIIGMGSCFDIWSWAWDVGKTPYAPPELEDDPTLPIVGYYPALLILTGVMAWVWVVAAWVGMKYFRHAKISGD